MTHIVYLYYVDGVINNCMLHAYDDNNDDHQVLPY